MSLKTKISLILSLIWIILAIATVYISQFIILKSFARLETKKVMESMSSVKHALHNEIENVGNMVSSWAIWDDSYRFIKDQNTKYINSNLTIESFSSTKMDFIFYFNTEGTLVYSLGLNPTHDKTIPIPKELLAILTPHSKIVALKNKKDFAEGFITLPEGLLEIASRPILTSKNTGPVGGTLIMAKYFKKETLQKIIQATRVSFSFVELQQILDQDLLKKIINQKIIYIKRNSVRSLTAIDILNDINDKPILFIQGNFNRAIYAAGVEMAHYYSLVFVIYSLILIFFLWEALQGLIVKRIKKLNPANYFRTGISSDSFADEVSDAAKLYQQATHDPLTGLANRSMLYQAFAHYAKVRTNCEMYVLFLDMDKFKNINDSLGHKIGDKLLISVTQQIASCIRGEDIAARLGGDEFVILLIDLKKEKMLKIVNRIFAQLSKPLFLDNHKLYVTLSMGISSYPKDGKTIAELLEKADIALYQAKALGRNNYQFYSAEMEKKVLDTKQHERELQQALDNNAFVLYYQPIYNAQTKKLINFEVLLRWQHPTKGLISANEFITLAERSGLIVPIGRLVLNMALKQMSNWIEKKLPVVPIAVNLSVLQTNYTAINQVIMNALTTYQIDPRFLELELTETGFIEMTSAILDELQTLRKSGIQLTVDDFGMGYAGLNYLRYLPISKLKIDKSFIIDLETDPGAKAITLAIIAIAHELNLQVIAEGVETYNTYNFLVENNIDAVQGHFFSPPLSTEECENLLTQIQKKDVHTF